MRRLLLLAAALTATTAAKAPDTPDHDLAGRTPGKPVDCISRTQVTNTHVYPDGRILYRMIGTKAYLNAAGPGCQTSTLNPVLVTVSPQSMLCQGDIVRVVDPQTQILYGSCNLSNFVPYARPKPPKP